MNRLTDADFWSKRWKANKGKKRAFSYDDNEQIEMLKFALREVPEGGSLLELGGAPGTMAILQSRARPDLKIDTLDISDEGVRQLNEIYASGNLNGEAFQQDFFEKGNLGSRYDAVTSFGLVEHFTDLPEVINAHIQFVRSGGVVYISIPNYSTPVVQRLINLFSHETVRTHNLSIMDPGVLKRQAELIGGKVITTGAFGYPKLPHSAFNPSLLGFFYHIFAKGFNVFSLGMVKIFGKSYSRFMWKRNVFVVISVQEEQ